MPLWYVVREAPGRTGDLGLDLRAPRRRCANLERDPSATLQVEAGEPTRSCVV